MDQESDIMSCSGSTTAAKEDVTFVPHLLVYDFNSHQTKDAKTPREVAPATPSAPKNDVSTGSHHDILMY